MKRASSTVAASLIGVVGLAGCWAETGSNLSADHEGPPGVAVEAEGLATSCGTIYYDSGEQREEWYSFGKMNRQLDADAVLRDRVGFGRVESCEQARAFTRTLQELLESVETERPAIDPAINSGDADLTPKILNGDPGPYNSVVRFNTNFGSCTGTLISPRVMLTAGHCIPQDQLYLDFDGDGTADGGGMNFWIHYDQSAGGVGNPTLYCLTAPQAFAAGSCDANESRLLMVRMHPDYSGVGNTGTDLALVISTAVNWSGPAGAQSAHWRRVNSGGLATDHDFRAVGQGGNANGGTNFLNDNNHWQQSGTGVGVLRDDLANLDWLGGNHFIHKGDHVRTCLGDSGGPAIERNAYTVAGVLSNFDYSSSYGSMNNPVPACADKGENQRWARVSSKIAWFNTVLSSHGLPQCTRSGSTNGVSWRECW